MKKWEIESKITSNFDGMLTQGQQEVLDYIEQLQQENKQLKSVLSEVRKYILEKCPHSAVFRNEHIDKIYEILNKVGD